MVQVYVPWYHGIDKTPVMKTPVKTPVEDLSQKRLVRTIRCLKNDEKHKHSGATGNLVTFVSIEDITVYYSSNSTARSAARTEYYGQYQ
jgi:hypothetical protein